MKRNEECTMCVLHEQCSYDRCKSGDGDPNADMMFIGDLSMGGQAMLMMRHVINKLGLSYNSMYYTHVLRCRPRDNKLPGKRVIVDCFESCWPYLEYEIQMIDPKVIVVMGGTALSLLCGLNGITKHECMKVDTVYEGAKTFASFHPAYVLRAASREVRLAQAIARAAKAAGKKLKPQGLEAGRFPYEVRS